MWRNNLCCQMGIAFETCLPYVCHCLDANFISLILLCLESLPFGNFTRQIFLVSQIPLAWIEKGSIIEQVRLFSHSLTTWTINLNDGFSSGITTTPSSPLSVTTNQPWMKSKQFVSQSSTPLCISVLFWSSRIEDKIKQKPESDQ